MAATLVASINFLITTVITLIIEVTLLISLIRKNRCNQSTNTANKNKYDYFVFGTFGCLILQSIGYLLYIDLTDKLFEKSRDTLIIFVIAFSFSPVVIMLTYLSLVYRLYDTFKDSVYEIPKWITYGHTIIALLIPSLYTVLYAIKQYKIALSVKYFILLLIFLGSFHLIYLFNHKLFILVLQQRQSIFNGDIELSQSQLNILRTLRKHSLLGSIMILILLYLANNASQLIHGGNSKLIWSLWTIYLWIYVICSNCIALLMYLGFAVNRKWYDCLCGYGDRICEQICIECTTKQINKKYKYVLMDDI